MILKPLDMAKQIISSAIKKGDTVIDATLGNGHDALFLANCVGEKGFVVGFDVQEQAVSSASIKLSKAGIEYMSFHQRGHEEMDQVMTELRTIDLLGYDVESVGAIMFNLGYLPRADKAVITTTETTLPALESSLRWLRKQGVLTVMCYPGHAGGDIEAAAVKQWAAKLSREIFRVIEYGYINAPNNPAFLVAVEKL